MPITIHHSLPFIGKWFQWKSSEFIPHPRMVKITVCGSSFPNRAVPMRPWAVASHCREVPVLISWVMENAVSRNIISSSTP